jgi:putative hydrolase of HD superfamily
MVNWDRTRDLLLRAARLKDLPRTGWLLRGVGRPESVAAHGYGTTLATLLLLDLVDAPLDRERALALAVLHDLPEAALGDVPTPAARHLPPGAKAAAEASLLDEMTAGTPVAASWRALWAEFDAGVTPEARLVRDADKLDLFLQALLYERAGNRDVGEFWERVDRYDWSYPASRRLLATIRAGR